MATYNLFCDLETTGLDVTEDLIAEIAVILTDDTLKPLDTYQTVIQLQPAMIDYIATLPRVKELHEKSGLWLELANGKGIHVADAETHILTMLDAHITQADRVFLAGSGVAEFDKHFLARQMPKLAARLLYRCHDVGYLRRAYFEATGTMLTDDDKRKTHRAMDDVECHLAEARAFRGVFQQHAWAANVMERAG